MNRLRILLFASALFSLLPLTSSAHAQEVTRDGSAAYTVHLLPAVVRAEAPVLAPEPVAVEAPRPHHEPRPVAWSAGLRAFARR
jgi:hypothetical protein